MSDDPQRLTPTAVTALQDWVGRTETHHDDLTAAPLPPLWHWLYFLPQHDAGDIGPDGHARRDPEGERMAVGAGSRGMARDEGLGPD